MNAKTHTVEIWNALVSELGITIPAWIDQVISPYDVAAIRQGDWSCGAYMPAITHYQAKETMAQHGDDVLDYIRDALGELPKHDENIGRDQLACFYLSYALALWAYSVEDDLESMDETPKK